MNVNEWKCVNEDLPKDEKSYLVFDSHHSMIRVCKFNPHYSCWDDEHGDDYYTDAAGGMISHWMELPNKPPMI